MFIPFGDDHPPERRPYVNYFLMAANILVFLLTLSEEEEGLIRWMLVPRDFEWTQVFTSMFMHANWMHLAGNMLFLWIFGANVEQRLTSFGYLPFYLASGVLADLAHVLGDPRSSIPTLGASGAISGVMGAYIVFFPAYRVKTFVWLWWWGARVFWIPALWWLGLWFLEQVLLGSAMHEGGGVAYLAHIGGFVVGAAVAGAVRGLAGWGFWPGRSSPVEPRPPERRFFAPVPEDPGIEWMDEPGDGYSVLRLSNDPPDALTIAQVVASITGQPSSEVARRLDSTRGMIARSVPREAARRIQRELHMHGIPSAIILHNRSNFPPASVPVEGVSWDDRALRLRTGEESILVPWTAPFLWVGAWVDGRPQIDLFLTRRSAFRIADGPGLGLVEVDPNSRTEVRSDLPGFARAILSRAAAAAVSEGVRAVAEGAGGGRLDFRSRSDYDDYVFWLYNLILAQSSRI